ncbi:hypothetical protein EON67_05275 [archaeon]|nr:MAG: hypothetical protein EON67_05275 [archaeon]
MSRMNAGAHGAAHTVRARGACAPGVWTGVHSVCTREYNHDGRGYKTSARARLQGGARVRSCRHVAGCRYKSARWFALRWAFVRANGSRVCVGPVSGAHTHVSVIVYPRPPQHLRSAGFSFPSSQLTVTALADALRVSAECLATVAPALCGRVVVTHACAPGCPFCKCATLRLYPPPAIVMSAPATRADKVRCSLRAASFVHRPPASCPSFVTCVHLCPPLQLALFWLNSLVSVPSALLVSSLDELTDTHVLCDLVRELQVRIPRMCTHAPWCDAAAGCRLLHTCFWSHAWPPPVFPAAQAL